VGPDSTASPSVDPSEVHVSSDIDRQLTATNDPPGAADRRTAAGSPAFVADGVRQMTQLGWPPVAGRLTPFLGVIDSTPYVRLSKPTATGANQNGCEQ